MESLRYICFNVFDLEVLGVEPLAPSPIYLCLSSSSSSSNSNSIYFEAHGLTSPLKQKVYFKKNTYIIDFYFKITFNTHKMITIYWNICIRCNINIFYIRNHCMHVKCPTNSI